MSERRTDPILVIAEGIEETRDRITLEAIAAAQRLAQSVDMSVSVAVLGNDAVSRADSLINFDLVSAVLAGSNPALEPFSARPWVDAVQRAVDAVTPSLVLIPATLAGRDIAPRLAARMNVPVASDVIGITIDRQGTVTCTRQVNGGRLITDITITARPSVISLRPGSLRETPASGGTAEVRELDLSGVAQDERVTIIQTTVAEKTSEGIATAARIVAGGRGLGKPENFSLVEELAAQLNAAVGASGAVVGLGWRPHSQQVGSTGTTVAPRLYLAVGISGAVQHTIGMSGADNIVAINRDPEAPIFEIVSLGVVGDLFEVVPALIDELKRSMDAPGNVDVVVWGAGIVGSRVAVDVAKAGRSVVVVPRGPASYPEFPGFGAVAGVFERRVDSEKRLLDEAQSHGAYVLHDESITAFAPEAGLVTLVATNTRTIMTRCVVLADGADPRIARSRGLLPDWEPWQIVHFAYQLFAGNNAPGPEAIAGSRDGFAWRGYRIPTRGHDDRSWLVPDE
jgi:electron transfer flavoprotein alpha subunit